MLSYSKQADSMFVLMNYVTQIFWKSKARRILQNVLNIMKLLFLLYVIKECTSNSKDINILAITSVHDDRIFFFFFFIY